MPEEEYAYHVTARQYVTFEVVKSRARPNGDESNYSNITWHFFLKYE